MANDGKMTTCIYRKPTFSGVYTHFSSFIPDIYKKGLISTILFRSFSFSSSLELFQLETYKLKKIFLKNGYPSSFFDECLQKFKKRIFEPQTSMDTVPKREFKMILPYCGTLSNKVQKKIKKLFSNFIPFGKISIVFKTQRRVSNMLKFKDSVPLDYDSHVIYHFKCPSCNAGYVGETRTYFKVRSSQHLGISPYTGKPGKPGTVGNPTSITKHIHAQKCTCSLSDFSIIGRETDYHKRLLKESLFIKLHGYALNENETSTKLFLF